MDQLEEFEEQLDLISDIEEEDADSQSEVNMSVGASTKTDVKDTEGAGEDNIHAVPGS